MSRPILPHSARSVAAGYNEVILMQAKDAEELRRRWGRKPCTHPKIVKEYDLSAATGDYVCTTCGDARWGSDWNTADADKK